MQASIIIATYQHAAYLADAIESALAQTVPCDVIVVDDGSTDRTAEVLARYANRIRIFETAHQGPCRARNLGLDRALGDCIMFLDADDVIAPRKVETQLAAFDDEIGWTICDVLIEDEAKALTTTASEQYRYAEKDLGGWIQQLLAGGNFIPIMSPLVRRSLLTDVRFHDDRIPEDWHFWNEVAARGRVRYVPTVLATYRHRRTGRSRVPKQARAIVPNITQPLRLNLGCGTPGTRSWHPMPGLVNLDKSFGWTFEEGLGEFVDRSVAGITVSHALMYVPEERWPFVFAEFARVLAPGGVIRITEDETADPQSSRVGGWQGSQPAVTLTTAPLVRHHLERAGLTAFDVTRASSRFPDRSLCQAQHGDPPDVFFIEGVRETTVLFAPHSDDETLFAAFSILKYRPHIVVCYPSSGDYGDTGRREAETRDAMAVLGGAPVDQWQGGDLVAQMRDLDARVQPARVLAPDFYSSHPDHRQVASAARTVFPGRILPYHTYDANGKVRRGRPVELEPAWISQKLRALARYESQITHPRAHAFFLEDLREYVGDVV